MSSTKSFINTFMLAIATLAITSCVPKATEKKAACGVNQAFSSVSRSCYSILEGRTKPVGTTATVAMSEETPKTITLAYTDGNKDKAVSCKVSSISTNLEMIAPSVVDGGLFIKADEIYLNASNIAFELSVSEVAMKAALDKAKAGQYYPTVATQLGVFKAQAAAILALGAGITNNATVMGNYTLGQERMLVFTSMMTNMSNRCECSGGVCSTVAIPKLNKTGAAGFSYTVTDVDGEGAAKSTAVTITAMSTATAHLKPVAQSGYYLLDESFTSVATAYSITIPDGNDLSGVANSTMRYYFNGTKNGSNQGVTTNGKVTGCMDLAGSSGLTDKTCIYTPTNGDAFDVITPVKASVVIGDLTYTGVAEGTAANSFSVQYFDLHNNNLSIDPYVSAPQNYGLVGGVEEAFIRVSGNAIKIFINPGVTTSTQIQTLVNAHKQASLMVLVSGATGVTPSPSILTPAAVSLVGGVDAFDKIPFYANNLQTSSTNTAYIMIKMNSVDDVPAMNYVASAAATYLEDPVPSPMLVNLTTTYSDSDTNASSPGPGYYNTCNIDPTDAIFLANFPLVGISCTCVLNVCTASITPNVDVSSTTAFTFSYRIGSVDTATAVTKYSEYRTFSLTMTPVNDAPQISIVALPTVTVVPAQTMLEGASTFVDVWVGPGGSGFETSQTVTLTATSSNLTLLPAASLVVSDTSPVVAGKKRITITPAANQSGTATITLTLLDTGGVTNGGVNILAMPVNLTVTPVNNAPVFLSSITAVETNEGGAVQSNAFQIDEDAGSSVDEDAQYITIDNLVSDNTSVLPTTAIRMFYDLNDNGVEDDGEERCAASQAGCVSPDHILETVETDDVKLHKLYLKLDPVDGISGNANITMTVSDHINTVTDPLYLANPATYAPLTASKSTTFSFIVHPIAALHGGWNNVSSVGLKTDKNGAPAAAAEIQCNYNKVADAKHCGTASCTGTASPNSTIVPDAANVIYWDSASLRCYRSTAADAFSWVDMNTSCPITRTAGVCSGDNCISATNPTGVVTPGMVGQYHLAADTNTCYVSTGTAAANWIQYTPAKVTLSWKQFIMVGSGPDSSVQIAGWNVYRRDAGTDYNLKGGHLKDSSSTTSFTITDPSVRTFTDTTAVAGRVYYYIVRPVDNLRLFPTYTPESFSEVRVIASPSNYSFVHRWIVNQEMCNGMNITTTTTPYHVDQTNNFRCEYSGPGSVNIGGTNYYDYGKDLLVDTQESGCAYAAAPKCTANGCIGIGSPTTLGYTAALNDLYYDRSSGACYINNGGAWGLFQTGALTTTIANKTNSALNAPLTNINKTRASAICTARTAPALTYTSLGVVTALGPLTTTQLPNKKDYMAYASQKLNITDPEVTELEQGYSLNIQSRCNGSSASGLETAFTDAAIPSTSFIYTLPGTFSSGIRSLYTGSIPWASSKGTEACVSRFGIQDLYGNVAELVDDGMTCDPDPFSSKACTVKYGGSFTATDFGTAPYSFDDQIGPFAEGGDSVVSRTTLFANINAAVATMTVASTANFPATGDLIIGTEQISYTGVTATSFTGLTRGVNTTVAAAHTAGDSVRIYASNDDAFLTNWTFGDQFYGASYFNYPLGLPISNNLDQTTYSAYIDWVLSIGPSNGITTNKLHEDGIIVNGSAGASKTFAVGGSYLSGNRAGRFSSELIDDTVVNRPDVGFRCVVPVLKTDYPAETNHVYPY